MRLATFILAMAFSAAARDPVSAYDRALNLFSRTDFSGAAAILKSSPPDARSLELLGRCYLMDADYGKAVDSLQKAVALDPSNSMTLTWLGRAYGHRAETAFPVTAIGLAGKAREALEKAVQLDPHNGEAIDDLFEFYLQAPSIVGGGHEKARELVPLIARIDPAQGQFADARLAEDKKLYGHAEAHLRRALDLAPQKVGRVLDLARFLSSRGRFDESDKVFEQAEAMAPGTPRVEFAHAEALIRARRNLADARALLNRYLQNPHRTPDDPPSSAALKLLRKAEGS